MDIHYYSFLLIDGKENHKTVVYKCRKLKTAISRLFKSGFLSDGWMVDYEVEVLDENKSQFKGQHSYLNLYEESKLKGYIN